MSQDDNGQFPKPWPMTRKADKENLSGIYRLKSAPSKLVSYEMISLYKLAY